MRNSPNQDAVLAAIQKKSPITRDALMKATGLDEQQLAQTVFALKKTPARIAVGGTTRSRLYGVPGTKFADRPTNAKPAKSGAAGKRTYAKRKPKPGSPESFADGVKARERELDALARTNGTDLPLPLNHDPAKSLGQYNADFKSVHDAFKQLGIVMGKAGSIGYTPSTHEATALPCRAIATAAGGAIVLRGNTLTAELSAEEVNVIHQLRA